jgi:hypothetical protein
MPRHRNVNPTICCAWRIPVELKAKLDLLLFSEAEGRVPLGDHSKFVAARIQEHFEWETLDLHPLGFPEGYFVRGPREMIGTLKAMLLPLNFEEEHLK